MRNGDNEDSDYGDLPGSKKQLTLCLLGGGGGSAGPHALSF